jgi:hypothetical protein
LIVVEDGHDGGFFGEYALDGSGFFGEYALDGSGKCRTTIEQCSNRTMGHKSLVAKDLLCSLLYCSVVALLSPEPSKALPATNPEPSEASMAQYPLFYSSA